VLFVALAFRLGVGVALMRTLPVYGYDEDPQRAGYVFYDSFARDEDSWARAKSDQPLISAFTDRRPSDQYGGLLFLSAAIYRFLGGDVHRPLLIVLPGAIVSSAGVLFAWAFTGLAFGGRAAMRAAWIMALYPESVLLGSSQMREPYLATALAVCLVGYALARAGQARNGGQLIGAGSILAAFFSPPTAVGMLALVVVLAVWEGWIPWGPSLRVLGRIAVPTLAAALLVLFVVPRLEGRVGVPARALELWVQGIAGEWRLRELAAQSDPVANVFRGTPTWAHFPLAVLYGVVQPFLPATIVDPGLALWRVIGLARSLGWFLILPFLFYAPLAAWKGTGGRSLATILAVLVWTVSVIAAFRASGFLWDSPRYRSIFLVGMAAVAAWAWGHAEGRRDPWLRRSAWLVAFATLVMLQWYVARYWPTPHLELPGTVLFLALGAAGLIGVWVAADRRRLRSGALTGRTPPV
jgi:4-amino-4-deoxy-L-arabinose transferase-like glycosyltransferase